MFLKSMLFVAFTALFAGQAIGADLTALDAVSACNCPDNCRHKSNSSCKFYAGPSDSSTVVKGKCVLDTNSSPSVLFCSAV